MRHQETTILDSKAIELRAPGATMIVLRGRGPRIMSLSGKKVGSEFMHVDFSYDPKKWNAFGGARVWSHGGTADETEMCYVPDNDHCEVFWDDSSCTVWGAPSKTFHFRRGYRITENSLGGFDVTGMIQNLSPNGMLLPAGVWQIAAVKVDSSIGVLLTDPKSKWQTEKIVVVRRWANHVTHPDFMKKQVEHRDGLIIVRVKGLEGKIMARSPVGTIIVQHPNLPHLMFFKQVRFDPLSIGSHPEGCDTAIYTSGLNSDSSPFGESETMGPHHRIEAGQTIEWTERWMVVNANTPNPWNDLDWLHFMADEMRNFH